MGLEVEKGSRGKCGIVEGKKDFLRKRSSLREHSRLIANIYWFYLILLEVIICMSLFRLGVKCDTKSTTVFIKGQRAESGDVPDDADC